MTTLFEASAEEPHVSEAEWDYKFVERMIRGLDKSRTASALDDENLLQATNVRLEQDELVIDTGYTTFGAATRGKPRATYQFFLKNGSSILTLLTNLTFYIWNEAELEWQYASNGTSTTLSVAASATDTSVDVADITGFADGEHIGIILDDGTQHQTTVNGTPAGSTIAIDDAIPSAAAIGNTVVEAVVLTGSDDIGVSLTTWAASDKMYFANGTDTPKEFDGVEVVDITGLPTSPFICRLVAIFNNYLLLMHTVESGTAFPQRVRWSAVGVDNSFPANNFLDLYDSEDWLIATDSLGPYQILYKERSIYRMEFLGAADQVFQFNRTIDAEGALNQDSVVNLGDVHVFMGNANFYEYDGGFTLRPIGDRIFDFVFAQDGILNPEFSQRSFGTYIEETDEIWWFAATGSDEFPQTMFRWKVATGAWTIRTYGINFVGFGFFQSQNDVTWATASGTWQGATGPWIGKQTQANAPTLHLCSGDQLRVYEYDYITNDDDGTDISYVVETKDFYVPNRELRFDRYDFMLKGTAVLIEVSYDEGVTWQTLGLCNQGSAFARHRIFKQAIGRALRFRFTGSNGFGLRWYGIRYRRESLQEVA